MQYACSIGSIRWDGKFKVHGQRGFSAFCLDRRGYIDTHACIGYLRFDVGGLVDFQIGQFVTSLKDIFRISITTLFHRYMRLPNGMWRGEILSYVITNL